MRMALLILFIVLLVSPGVRAQSAQSQTAPAEPCKSQAESRQFDFWIGEWDVFEDNQKVAESSIQQIIGGCVIFENYNEADGFSGKSFNFYDSHLRKWRQTWVDVRGMVSEFSGEVKNDAMEYEGESHLPDGRNVLRKMTLTVVAPDRVRQVSQISTDGGKTWRPHYDLLYIRKKS